MDINPDTEFNNGERDDEDDESYFSVQSDGSGPTIKQSRKQKNTPAKNNKKGKKFN